MNRLNLAACTLLTLMALGANNARAANALITWQTPGTISGGSDVSTLGTLFDAANNGGTGVPAVTVAGVTFNPFVTNGTSSSYTDASGNLSLFVPVTATKINGGNNFGGTQSPFNVLSPTSYQTLLGWGSAYSNAALTLRINNLTIGQQYLVELWANDSNINAPWLPAGETVSAGNSAFLRYNTTSETGGVGQYVTGTFTATGLSENIGITVNSNGTSPYALLNAVEVRNLSVPEPSSVAMLGAGFALLLAVTRFRYRRA